MLPSNIAVAQHFIDLVEKGGDRSTAILARCLDELALSYHDTPAGEPNDSDEPMREDQASYADISAKFPDLGYYSMVDPDEFPGEPCVGDAIDDIMDITNDLKEVIWRFERFGSEDAHWHFRMLYQIHWGQHLRNLARYLHSRLPLDCDQ